MDDSRPTRTRTLLLCLGLVAAVFALYGQSAGFAFVRYDDPDYVLENRMVRQGLTWSGVRWAFGSAYASNWHPLTWLAHMLDVQLFGLEPAGHHLMSVALHALASVLCFLALRALLWRRPARERQLVAAGAAFLFALHPLRVESVAWVSERKDVLSGVAFFLTLLAYVRHVRAPSRGRYASVLGAFALGLLAKPMLVSLPLVLLALDRWPLARTESTRTRSLLLEKLPLFGLAALSALVTIHAQREGGALYTLEVLPLSARLANAPLALLGYLGHFFWPVGLAYFYPHRALVDGTGTGDGTGSTWNLAALAALALVLGLSALAILRRRRWPAFTLAWSWLVAMLLPVLGLVQVGEQALADRYAYLPFVGPQLALAFGLVRWGEARPARRLPLGLLGALALLACALQSARQARVWRDSEALFRNALLVTEHNYAAFAGLGNELAARGEIEAARAAYEDALHIRPDYGPALYSLGLLEQQHGDPDRALTLYRAAQVALPGFAAASLNLGSLLAQRGATVDAAQAFERVLELFPEHPDAHFDLALLFLLGGGPREALPHLARAVRSRPDFFAAWEKLGEAQEALGQHELAVAAFEQALGDPHRNEARTRLAWILASAFEPEHRDPARALSLARQAVAASRGEDPQALEALAAALALNGDFARAVAAEEEALRRLPPGQQGSARARLERYRRGETFLHTH